MMPNTGHILQLVISRPSLTEYSIMMNSTELNLEIVRLSDGGILVRVAKLKIKIAISNIF